MNLKNAKALVTGGSLGIGYATAKALIDKGAKVAICGRNSENLNNAAKELGALAVKADVSVEKDVVDMVKTVVKELGDFNVLINNAAFGYFAHISEIELEKFNKMLAVNLTGAMLCAREASKHFIKQKYGNIVNISSTAGTKGYANGTPYVASKFALAGMTECWRAELRKSNIRVMLVNPSEVQTDFSYNSATWLKSFIKHGEEKQINPTKLVAEDIAHTIISMLELDDRGFITEATVWATNPS
ncbi:MAG: SDR family oxidoreductase [Chlorobi bacterium]|nr:SDR family oxidoreductase [Chlorobiota bacterium]MCI0716037.1 SDR family oxidoreductase [Chlorobiota bacterium]